MFEEFGNIGLTREQFRDVILNYILAMHVRRRSAVSNAEDIAHLEELERHLLSFASGFEADDLVERSDDSLYPSKALDEECHKVLAVADEEEFWNRLSEELAWRDYLNDLPSFARETAEEAGVDPPDAYYDKYEKEFERSGVDKLFLKEDEVK